MKVKTTKGLSSMTDRQIIQCYTALMDRKLELVNQVLEGKRRLTLETYQESQEIGEQLKLIEQNWRNI